MSGALAQSEAAAYASGLKKFINFNSGFAENGAERTFRHIASMMRECNLAACFRTTPNFVAAGTGAVEDEPKRAEAAGNFAIPEA